MKPAVKARPLTQVERALVLLRERQRSTLDFHASYILAVTNVIFRLRHAGHVIHTSHPNGKVAVYTLVSEAA